MIEGGRVKRISVAVLVDGIYGKNDKGEPVYQPRGKEELDRIAALVRSAIGFDQKRGDRSRWSTCASPSSRPPLVSEPTGLARRGCSSPRTTSCAASSSLVMALLGLIVVLFVVRPLVRRIITPEEVAALAGGRRARARRRLRGDRGRGSR